MNFPILSAIIFIPLIGAFFILITRGPQKNVEKNSKYVAIFSSLTNFLLSLFLWYSFGNPLITILEGVSGIGMIQKPDPIEPEGMNEEESTGI